jgi:hypothetical protein
MQNKVGDEINLISSDKIEKLEKELEEKKLVKIRLILNTSYL